MDSPKKNHISIELLLPGQEGSGAGPHTIVPVGQGNLFTGLGKCLYKMIYVYIMKYSGMMLSIGMMLWTTHSGILPRDFFILLVPQLTGY